MKEHINSTSMRCTSEYETIERIVCSGGGAKGVVYPGAYQAMVDTGIFPEVEALAGASAGAITASLLAVGMHPKAFREKSLTTNFKELLGNRSKIKAPGVAFITKDGLPIEQFIREKIIETLREVLAHLDRVNLDEQNPELKTLLKKISDPHPRITFGDLAILNRYCPRRFKQLIVSAVQFPHGELQIFNSELTPEVEIALACRASASIPIVLAPVEIEINGIKRQFVDGGLYDNLPTDFFDRDEQGHFVKNKKPLKTLVFAFGEGLNNKKNQVFQALYGSRWDEIITDEVLQSLITEALHLSRKSVDLEEILDSEEESQLLIQAVMLVLKNYIREKKLGIYESMAILDAMKLSIKNLLIKTEQHPIFWIAYKKAPKEERLNLFATFIKEKMKPILYGVDFLEKTKRDVLVELFGDLQLPYKNTQQKELGYQKLRHAYPFRTVELRVGTIKTTDFTTAFHSARVMDALGYLDTINHLTNYNLHHAEAFNAEQFYIDLFDHFMHIYEAVLLASKREPSQDLLLQEIKGLQAQFRNKSAAVSSRQILQFIKERVEQHMNSIEAFALSRAIEFSNATLSADELFKETYEEGFNQTGFFSLSNITGEQIFKKSSLRQQLKDKSMFELYKNRTPNEANTRTEKVFQVLSKLKTFNEAYKEKESVDCRSS